MSWVSMRPFFQSLAKSIDRASVVTVKEGWFWETLAALAPIFTFGGMSRRRFLEEFATTIGPVQAYPRSWSVERVMAVIPHEARHTRQARWFGLMISPWLGLPLMAIAYYFVFFPVGLAWARYRLELDADAFGWRYRLRHGARVDDVCARARNFAGIVGSGAYGYPWPALLVRRGFERKLRQVLADDARSMARLFR